MSQTPAFERFLSESERTLLLAVATAALPAGRHLPAADGSTVSSAEAIVAHVGRAAAVGYRGLLWSLEARALARFGKRFAGLPPGRRLELLDGWRDGEATRLLLRGLLTPLKLAHFETARAHAAVGCSWGVEPPKAPEKPRWWSQVTDARTFTADEELECDAVVVGTGAGGAVVAKELAEQGFAVLMLEEGDYHTRDEFNGRPAEMMRKLYRSGGFTIAYGNSAIPVPVGRCVGGTTTINAGTCLRAPAKVLDGWVRDHGLSGLSAAALDAPYRRVEQMLQVAPAGAVAYGRPGSVIARGCDALGFSHGPLTRNAPDCDGQGVCCLGCPTDAKRSTNVSYVPAALERSAQLLTGVRVERVLVDGDTARGVVGRVRSQDGLEHTLTVRAKVVVLACGSLHTPSLLLRGGLANASGALGRNLSVHPALGALGVFDEEISSARAAPQGYSITQFHDEGLLFEGASAPFSVTSAALTSFGPAYVELMERFNQTLTFGFMVKDTSRGRVRPGRGGEPFITYRLNAGDLALLRRGLDILCRVLFAAGAREVHPSVAGWETLRDLRDVDALARAPLAARHLDLTAWHPLGTARMGVDPLRSVVDATQETHDVHNLWVCDGSVMPGSLGVNPQLTIMALATRASTFVGRRLERLQRRAG